MTPNTPADGEALAEAIAEPVKAGDASFDDDAVYQFSRLMKEKMAKSRAKGRGGWHDPERCSPNYLRSLLYEHIYKGDPVDVANICMMLRHYQEPTTPQPEDDLRLPRPAEPAQAAQVATLVEKAVRGVSDLTHWVGDDDNGTTLVALEEALSAIRAAAQEGRE